MVIPISNSAAALTGALLMTVYIASGQQMDPPPSDAVFYDTYTVSEKFYYTLPDDQSLIDASNKDLINFRPKEQAYSHMTYANNLLERFSEIIVIENSATPKWGSEVHSISIQPNRSIVKNSDDEILSDLTHSQYMMDIEDSLQSYHSSNGFTPPRDLPTYEELDMEEMSANGYLVEQLNNGYRIYNDFSETVINLPHKSSTYTVYSHAQVFDQPYEIIEYYQTTSQGFLTPVYTQSKTKTLTKNGLCVIESHSKDYQDRETYYSPSVLSSESLGEGLESDFTVYPNPTDGEITIEYTGSVLGATDEYSINVFDNSGNEIYSTTSFAQQNVNLNLSSESSAIFNIYFQVYNNTFSKSIIKN